MRRMTAEKSCRRRLILFSVLALILIGLSILAPYIVPNDPAKTYADAMKAAPCARFPLGTDKYGRCILSRGLAGAPTTIFSSLALVLITFAGETLLGMLCGYFGGVLDTFVMRIVDILLAFPQMVLAIAVAGILGGGLVNAMIAIGITSWTLYARLARSTVLKLKEECFIAAAQFSRCGNMRILFRHMLPNMIGPLLVCATTQIGVTIIDIAGLSFLGVGITPPQPEWGSMISEARAYMQLAPWAVAAPGAAIIITIVVFNCLGDAVRDWMDEKEAYEE